MLQRITFNIGDKGRVGDHVGAEHGHAPGHGQHAFGQGHGEHVDVTLGEAQLVPLAHDVAAAHFTKFVGGQAADIAEQLKPGHGFAHYAGGEHGIAVDHCNHCALIRQMAGDGTKTKGQAIALAGAGDAYKVQFDPGRRVEPLPHAFDQQLIGHLDQRADDGGGQAAVDRFANHRAVHLGGGQGVDAKTGDHQEHVRGVGRRAQFAHFAPQVRVHHI